MSLVSEFLINPVLRQARRLSEISRSTFTTNSDQFTAGSDRETEPLSDTTPPQSPSFLSSLHYSPQTVGQFPISTTENAIYSSPPPSSPIMQARHNNEIVEESTAEEVVCPTEGRTAEGEHDNTSSKIVEEDMDSLRKKLVSIQSQDISPEEKGKLMFTIMNRRYEASRRALAAKKQQESQASAALDGQVDVWEQIVELGPLEMFKYWQGRLSGDSPSSLMNQFTLTSDDARPSYIPDHKLDPAIDYYDERRVLGCEHYRRNVKLQCSTCHRWYPCRFCHNAVEDHTLKRHETKNMLCMLCGCPQRASDTCIKCGESASRYYCNICKLWDDHPTEPIYHCNDCGICRRGYGLGKDYFHCKTCSTCISMSVESDHKCVERATDCNCPICGEYMFNSTTAVVFMSCGHSIHETCYGEHMMTSYKCPICNKSLGNMESRFRNLDLAILSQPMPPEFQDTKAVITCNDCLTKSTVPYHWLGLKCAVCSSYNTFQTQILAQDSQESSTNTNTVAVEAQPSTNASTSGLSALLASANSASQSAEVIGESAAQTRELTFLLPPQHTLSRRHSADLDDWGHADDALGTSAPPASHAFRHSRSVSPELVHFPGSSVAVSYDEEDSEDDFGDGFLGLWPKAKTTPEKGSLTSKKKSNHDDEDDDEDSPFTDEEDSDDDYFIDDGREDDSDDEILLPGHL